MDGKTSIEQNINNKIHYFYYLVQTKNLGKIWPTLFWNELLIAHPGNNSIDLHLSNKFFGIHLLLPMWMPNLHAVNLQ